MTAARSTKTAVKPKYIVIDDVFIAQTTEGELKIPIRLKTKLVRHIKTIDDNLDQMIAILEGIGDSATPAKLDELDIFDTMELVEEFFKAFTAKAEASAGESSGSSTS